ncbi:DNA-directed RNA polymerase I subunit rpa49-like [Rhododendron vialii]|uniref:DNA-directed RNA polymerase I subunit rpa49-like n=1 Tax=Rhododendron vialii TaxID=182163 RepID=UPI00265E4BB0|nr:DNA-directed RNA polymerase I subunit rpa49-like [Rhododendron vialii]
MAKPDIHTAETNEEKPATQAEEEEQNTPTPKKHKKTEKKNREEEEIHVKIETLGENPNKVSPFVGYFPSGYVPLKNQADGPTVRVFRHEKWTKRLQLVVSPNNGSQVDFVGTNYSGEATAPQLCTYALGVLDKQLQTLKIVPIASNKIFRLEPRVRGLDLSVKEPSQEELTPEKKHVKMRDTTLIFGTKKDRKRMMKFEALHPKEDPEALGRKFEGVKINKEALESAVMHSSRNAPPHDSCATTPQMAYPLDKIIFKGEWDYLVDILELLQDGAEVAPDGYPSFICNRLHRLESIKDGVEKKRLACVFSYINHLIKFKDKHSREGFSSAKHHKIPSILSQKFSTMFGGLDREWLADEEMDLLIRYVLVLTLIADGFTTAVSDIAKDLRMHKNTVREHFEQLGCKLMSENKVWLATLSLPLEFPKPKYKRKKK